MNVQEESDDREQRAALLALLEAKVFPGTQRQLLKQLIAMGAEWGHGVDDQWSKHERALFTAVTGANPHASITDWPK